MNEDELIKKSKSVRGLFFAMAAYTGTSILGPLLLFSFFGYLLDSWLQKSPIFLLSGILVAFITTNILIFKKMKRLNDKLNKEIEKESKDKNNQKDNNKIISK